MKTTSEKLKRDANIATFLVKAAHGKAKKKGIPFERKAPPKKK